jgi:hypothetical protein
MKAFTAAAACWRVAFENSFSFLAAFVFVIAFSVIGQREARAREEAEALASIAERQGRFEQAPGYYDEALPKN